MKSSTPGIPPLDLSSQRSSTAKVLDVLKTLANDPLGSLGVTDISTRVNLPKSTVHRILQELVEGEAIERLEGQYILAPWLVAQLRTKETNISRELRELLTPFLTQLYTLTHHTVQVAVLNGVEVLYLNKLNGIDSLASPSRAGGRAPAYCTGVGKVLLAHNPAATRATLATNLLPWTPHTITNKEEFLKELESVRTEGFGYDREEIQLGLTCVAAPIEGKKGVIAAMSVSGVPERFAPGEYKGVLGSVCDAASRALKA